MHQEHRRRIVEAGVELFHAGAEIGEGARRRLDQRRDLAVDFCKSKSRAEGDAQALDAVAQPGAVIGVVAGSANQSRTSGRAITFSSSAASLTVRAIGPAWLRVANGLGG